MFDKLLLFLFLAKSFFVPIHFRQIEFHFPLNTNKKKSSCSVATHTHTQTHKYFFAIYFGFKKWLKSKSIYWILIYAADFVFYSLFFLLFSFFCMFFPFSQKRSSFAHFISPGMMILELRLLIFFLCSCILYVYIPNAYTILKWKYVETIEMARSSLGSFSSAFNLNFGFDFSYISHWDAFHKNPYKYIHCTRKYFIFICATFTRNKIIAQYTTFSVKTFYFYLSICVKGELRSSWYSWQNFTFIRNKCV